MSLPARPTVSVIIVSYGRPGALHLCLTALGQLLYDPFEVVVVACDQGLRSAAAHPLAGAIRRLPAPGRNISAARNTGLAHAAGDVVAFLDDDAIPEPFWLDHLVWPLAAGQADLSGGHVTGRNGFDLQWGARAVNGLARHRVLEGLGPEPSVPDLPVGEALRTEGTNMAATRRALAALGGFDTGFAFYLDDTDLNLRARAAGLRTATVPRARVWHRQLPSPRRGPDRVPLDLTDIGRSLARFLDRHATPEDRDAARLAHREAERRRALAHMLRGTLMPGDVGRLLAGFDAGFEQETQGDADWDGACDAAFSPLPDPSARDRPTWVEQVGPGFRAHRIVFAPPGIWTRRGGRFGRRNQVDSPKILPDRDDCCATMSRTGPNSRGFSPFSRNSERN